MAGRIPIFGKVPRKRCAGLFTFRSLTFAMMSPLSIQLERG
jgi:hypothetical protein